MVEQVLAYDRDVILLYYKKTSRRLIKKWNKGNINLIFHLLDLLCINHYTSLLLNLLSVKWTNMLKRKALYIIDKTCRLETRKMSAKVLLTT